MWPYEGRLLDYIDTSGTVYAKSLEHRDSGAPQFLRIEAGFQPAFGSHRKREVTLMQRILDPDRLLGPAHHRHPGRDARPGHLDARCARAARPVGEPAPPHARVVALPARAGSRVMLFVHEVHEVVGKHGGRVRGRLPRRLDADARRGRRRPPALVHEPRPRQRRVVQRRHHHRRARRRGVGAPGGAHPARRPARVVARGRHVPPRRDRQGHAAGALVAHPGGRLRRRCPPTAASTSCTSSWRTPAGRRRRSTTTSRRGTTSTASRCSRYADDMRAIPIDIQACFQNAHGSSVRREAMLWQYIPDPADGRAPARHRAAARAAGAGDLHVRRARVPRPVEEPAAQDREPGHRSTDTTCATSTDDRPTWSSYVPGSTPPPVAVPGPSTRTRARRGSA